MSPRNSSDFLKPSHSIFNIIYRRQLLAAIAVEFLTLAHGIVTGWISPTLFQLQSDDSPTNFVITLEQVSWIGSLFGVGALSGTILFGLTIDRIGRKWCMYLIAMPYMAAWILVYFSKTYVYLYVARFLNGVTGGGNYIVISIFVSEISDPSIRGALSSMAMLFLSVGMIAGFLLSSYVDYYLNPFIILIFPVIYLASISFLYETPQHLLRKEKIEKARLAFRFYKNLPKVPNVDSPRNKQREMQVAAEFEELKYNILSDDGHTEKVTYKDFVNPEALKSFLTVFVFLFVNQFSGGFALLNYLSDIFALTGSDIHPNTCTNIVGVVQTIGIFLAVMWSDRFGRKILMLVSTGGMAIGLFIFGLYVQLASAAVKLEYNWFPLVTMCFIVLVASIGIVGQVFTVIVENLPVKIRSAGASLSMVCLSVLIFIALKIFPLIMKNYGLNVIMYCCGTVCALGWFYLLLFMKETKCYLN